jgi:hypothetical protein
MSVSDAVRAAWEWVASFLKNLWSDPAFRKVIKELLKRLVEIVVDLASDPERADRLSKALS